MNVAEHNKLFGCVQGTRFREPEAIEDEIEDLETRLQNLRLELRESKKWHLQGEVFAIIGRYLAGEALTDEEESTLQWCWREDDAE